MTQNADTPDSSAIIEETRLAMTDSEEDRLDEAIPALAVEALSAASRRALNEGHTIVVVQDGVLVQKSASGITPLRKLPGRQRVDTRTKNASS